MMSLLATQTLNSNYRMGGGDNGLPGTSDILIVAPNTRASMLYATYYLTKYIMYGTCITIAIQPILQQNKRIFVQFNVLPFTENNAWVVL